MPKAVKDFHEEIKYHQVRKGSDPGCYQLHRPTDCGLKFTITKRPIHKCELPKREYTLVPQIGGWRTHLIPRKERNYYPAIMHKSEYERLKRQAKIVTQEDQIEAMKAQEEAIQRAAKESDERKQQLKESLRPQLSAVETIGTADRELEGPDQATYTLSRAESNYNIFNDKRAV